MKDRIICESIESLRQEGLRFSVDTLAKRLNVSKKTVYKYFPTKESLALALYQRYYADIITQANRLIAEGSVFAHSKLLFLYFDALSMTSCDIFNKYKLNQTLYSYTAEQNDYLLEIILSTAGFFTFVYIISRAVGKIGGAYIGGKLTKAQPVVTKYLGFTLLPHSGVSLVFTGIATATLSAFDPSLAETVSGTIVAAAIINEIIAVIVAKYAFKWAGEIGNNL